MHSSFCGTSASVDCIYQHEYKLVEKEYKQSLTFSVWVNFSFSFSHHASDTSVHMSVSHFTNFCYSRHIDDRFSITSANLVLIKYCLPFLNIKSTVEIYT